MGFLKRDAEEPTEEQTNQDPSNMDSVGDRIAELEKSVEDARDQLLRRTAEMENMRRRFQQEREALIFEGNKRLILDLLSVVDDLERTLQHASEANDPMTQGIDLVYKNFLKTLERYGVTTMQTAGEQFDPMKHDALMEEPRADVAPGAITKEIQRGYMMRDGVLRHAKVIVAREVEGME